MSSLAGRRRIRFAVIVFTSVTALTAATITGAVSARRTLKAPPSVVQMAGGGGFFEDPAVLAALRNSGIDLRTSSKGSSQIAALPNLSSRYHLANAGNLLHVATIEDALKDPKLDPESCQPFSSPLAVITSQKVYKLLEATGIATTSPNGIRVFDVGKYLDSTTVGNETKQLVINGNRVRYPLHTTDPRYSNSGALFAVIAKYVLDKAHPSTGEANTAAVRDLFDLQGSMQTHTPELLRQFLTDGGIAVPIALIYENDYLQSRLNKEASGDTVLMYPNPTVVSDNALVTWTEEGKKVCRLLSTDPGLLDLEEKSGYRTVRDREDFVQYFRGHNITVPDLNALDGTLASAPTPAGPAFDELMKAIGRG